MERVAVSDAGASNLYILEASIEGNTQMTLITSLRQRGARAAFVLLLSAATLLGVAAVAAAAPSVLPVEPDGGIGGEVVLPVEPDGGIGD